jgi:hypothetical protein
MHRSRLLICFALAFDFDLRRAAAGGTNISRYPKNGYVLSQPPSPFSPSGLPLPPICRYTRRLSKVRQRVLPAMEINPILNTIKDLSERSETIKSMSV